MTRMFAVLMWWMRRHGIKELTINADTAEVKTELGYNTLKKEERSTT